MARVNILLVEDEATDVELTLRTLKQHHSVGHVYAVRDGLAAMDYLFRQGDYADCADPMPQLLLLDLKLPKLNGLQVLELLRQDPRTATIPVVMLTESQLFRDIQSAYQFSAISYLPKPVSLQYLSKAMDELGL
jgi:CheY-like chemotaxis protein